MRPQDKWNLSNGYVRRAFVKGDFTQKAKSPLTGIYRCYNSSEKKSLSTFFTS